MRWLVLAMAAALTYAGLPLQAGMANPGTSTPPAATDSRAEQLRALRQAAGSALVVGRDTDGDLRLLGSRTARPLATPHTRPGDSAVAAARGYLQRFGRAVGLDSTEELGTPAVRSSPAGQAVRFQQIVDGLPVLGGELVVGLDDADNLTSLGGETTTAAPQTAAPSVPVGDAVRTAQAVSRRAHRGVSRRPHATAPELWFYDPALFGVADPVGARPVWRVEVSDGLAVRDLVLVDAGTGRVVLRMDQVNGIDRVVCDRANVPFTGTETDCSAGYVRTETGSESADVEVEAAFDHAGAASTLFAEVGGFDVTARLGVNTGDGVKLRSTVGVCVADEPCPWPNAFWNGRGMYYGQGYAVADDVVAHELTHGVIDQTAGLFYWYQSGAINESFADVFGELVDLRNGPDVGDRPWLMGEDTADGALRDMADPTRFGEPDRMTSPLYAADPGLWDSGGVHTNSGVGNKAAYLIAEGGTFNGHDIRGLDAGLTHKPKTAAIYWAALNLLTSASDYEDLAWVLPQACRNLASAGTAGIVADDCAQVVKAVTATEMNQQPVDSDAAAPEAPQCHVPSTVVPILSEDVEGTSGHSWTVSSAAVWDQSLNGYSRSYATSGDRSFFAWDPDPLGYGDPADSWLSSQTLHVPGEGRTFLRFNHAYLFEWYDTGTSGRQFVDGGRVEYSVDGGPWTNAAGLDWVSGPARTLTFGGDFPADSGFGGDSHGYVSSRVDLTALAGHIVRLRWRITGDQQVSSGLGWWLDDITVYTCQPHAPGAPQFSQVQSGDGTVKVTWQPPAWPGTGIDGYRVTASPGQHSIEVPASAGSARLTGLREGVDYRVAVRAFNSSGNGDEAVHDVAGTRLTIGAPVAVTYGQGRVTGRLTRTDTGAGLWGNIVRLYSQPATGGPWTFVAYTGASRTGDYTFDVTPKVNTRYQTRFAGLVAKLGSRSAGVVTKVRPRLTAGLAASVVPRGDQAWLLGRVYPSMVGDRLLLQRRVGTGWRTVTSLTISRRDYRFVLPTGTAGSFDYRVYKPADARRLAGFSPSRRLRVR